VASGGVLSTGEIAPVDTYRTSNGDGINKAIQLRRVGPCDAVPEVAPKATGLTHTPTLTRIEIVALGGGMSGLHPKP